MNNLYWIKGVKKCRLLSILLSILGASLYGILLTGKGRIRAGEGTVRVCQFF